MSERTRLSHLSNWIMTGCGIWLVALGAYFIVLRPPRLPEDPRFMGAPLAPLRVAAPGLEGWYTSCSPAWAATWSALQVDH